MKKVSSIRSIAIQKPCSENWDNMTPHERGKHCQLCRKTVVDFSGMSQQKTLTYLSKKKGEQVCGRFDRTQLVRLNHSLRPAYKHKWKSLIASLALLASSQLGHAQHRNLKSTYTIESSITDLDTTSKVYIRGTIIGRYGYPVEQAQILSPTDKVSAITNADGEFILGIPIDQGTKRKIIIQSEGFKDLNINLKKVKNREIHVFPKKGYDQLNMIVGDLFIDYSYSPWARSKRFWSSILKKDKRKAANV
ncbi:MAG: hypothetical protein AAFY71_06350 [Bacteroidota bacterium]